MKNYTIDFLYFGVKEALSCVFAGSFFLLLFASHKINLYGMYRYDFLFLVALVLQALLVIVKIETVDELKVICVFHVLGLVLEIFKTHPAIGSWTYPEAGCFKILNVPLYSGFMYAAVASYIIQAWRWLKLRIVDHPPTKYVWVLAILIYLNFFTHHFLFDIRWALIAVTCFIFWKTQVYFTPRQHEYKMPLLLSFVLIGFFIWVAENIATFYGAWKYPNQMNVWSRVHIGKWNSWSLLVIMTFIVVTNLKIIKETISFKSPDSKV